MHFPLFSSFVDSLGNDYIELEQIVQQEQWHLSNTLPKSGNPSHPRQQSPKTYPVVSTATSAWKMCATRWLPSAVTSTAGPASTSGSISRALLSPQTSIHNAPFAKSKISHSTVVPLYGRGSHTTNEGELEEKAPSIPPRPPACGTKALISYHNPNPNQQYHEENSSPPSFSSSMEMGGVYPGMFGEMVYARVFGNSESLYAYPNSYHLMGNSSPRLRRQEIHADRFYLRLFFSA
ncbi:RING membrane-anchor 3 [Actinidia rufa]|uniref:E3 ubiquitin-protein ligase RMA n=1 Tax=Actinidia rufa TaxID=165716 RepID=A0A7J0G671_9ERIC|nr:RING membrane-anchor 3 [Actinidia rufa]